MSLIARFLENQGLPTVGIFLQESMARNVPAPRMLHVKWPFGHPYGEPNKPLLQGQVLRRTLRWAAKASQFGDLDQPDWPWRRTEPNLPHSWTQTLTEP